VYDKLQKNNLTSSRNQLVADKPFKRMDDSIRKLIENLTYSFTNIQIVINTKDYQFPIELKVTYLS